MGGDYTPGPYALDVLSILERMKMEGLKPTPLSITHVLMALRDASPPQVTFTQRHTETLVHM
jgi:hypothetical protein